MSSEYRKCQAILRTMHTLRPSSRYRPLINEFGDIVQRFQTIKNDADKQACREALEAFYNVLATEELPSIIKHYDLKSEDDFMAVFEEPFGLLKRELEVRNKHPKLRKRAMGARKMCASPFRS
jgi:hypothetical protein